MVDGYEGKFHLVLKNMLHSYIWISKKKNVSCINWVLFLLIIQNDHLFLIASKIPHTPGFESRTGFGFLIFFFVETRRFFAHEIQSAPKKEPKTQGWKRMENQLRYAHIHPPKKKMKEFRYQKKMIRWKEWTCGSAASSNWMIVVGVSILLNFRVVNSVGSWALWNDLLPIHLGNLWTYGLDWTNLFFGASWFIRGERFMNCLV